MEKFFQKNIWKKVHATDSVFLLIALVDPYCSLDFGSGYNRQLLTAEKLQIKTKKKLQATRIRIKQQTNTVNNLLINVLVHLSS